MLIQSLNSQRGNSISLVKSEVKGDVKLDIPSGGGGDITINYIWEI